MVNKYDALGGINAGGFQDDGGSGLGGVPEGLTLVNGESVGKTSDTSVFVGFDDNGLMYVGYFDAWSAEQNGIHNGVSFGPILIMNGEPVDANSLPSGVNPRTSIGQRADGAVMMLVIDGRQVHSMGATYADCLNIMLDHGAVNAINMDGGSSTSMYYNGEYVNRNSSQHGARPLPSAFRFARRMSSITRSETGMTRLDDTLFVEPTCSIVRPVLSCRVSGIRCKDADTLMVLFRREISFQRRAHSSPMRSPVCIASSTPNLHVSISVLRYAVSRFCSSTVSTRASGCFVCGISISTRGAYIGQTRLMYFSTALSTPITFLALVGASAYSPISFAYSASTRGVVSSGSGRFPNSGFRYLFTMPEYL